MTKDIPYYCDNDDSNIIRLFVIRHGQTEHNVQKILQGHQDTDLNRTGIAQAAKLGDYLEKSNIKFDKVFSSDLKRCKQTIQKVLETSGQANVSVEYCKGLRERCMGSLKVCILQMLKLMLQSTVKAHLEILEKVPMTF